MMTQLSKPNNLCGAVDNFSAQTQKLYHLVSANLPTQSWLELRSKGLSSDQTIEFTDK
jgi:hypothetical protein